MFRACSFLILLTSLLSEPLCPFEFPALFRTAERLGGVMPRPVRSLDLTDAAWLANLVGHFDHFQMRPVCNEVCDEATEISLRQLRARSLLFEMI